MAKTPPRGTTARDTVVQYTIRQVPPQVDRALRRRARDEHKSMNRLLLEALEAKAGTAGVEAIHHDLDALIGRWTHDPAFDAAIAAQDRIDEELWRR